MNFKISDHRHKKTIFPSMIMRFYVYFGLGLSAAIFAQNVGFIHTYIVDGNDGIVTKNESFIHTMDY